MFFPTNISALFHFLHYPSRTHFTTPPQSVQRQPISTPCEQPSVRFLDTFGRTVSTEAGAFLPPMSLPDRSTPERISVLSNPAPLHCLRIHAERLIPNSPAFRVHASKSSASTRICI